MTETELAQAGQLRCDFPRWVVIATDHGFTGRRRVAGIAESWSGSSADVLRSHLANAEFEDIHAEVRARSG